MCLFLYDRIDALRSKHDTKTHVHIKLKPQIRSPISLVGRVKFQRHTHHITSCTNWTSKQITNRKFYVDFIIANDDGWLVSGLFISCFIFFFILVDLHFQFEFNMIKSLASNDLAHDDHRLVDCCGMWNVFAPECGISRESFVVMWDSLWFLWNEEKAMSRWWWCWYNIIANILPNINSIYLPH